MIGDQLQLALHRLADGDKAGKVAIDRKTLQCDGVGAEVRPKTRPARRIHLRVDAHLDPERGEALFHQIEQKRRRNGDAADSHRLQSRQQHGDLLLPGPRPLPVAEAGSVQEVIESDAMRLQQADIAAQLPP